MRKVLKLSALILLIGIIGIIIYFVTGKGSGYQSIYLVPSDAVYIIKSKNPSESINTIAHTDIWEYLKTNKSIDALNKNILMADSILNKNKLLLKLLASRELLVSCHPESYQDFNYLFITNLNKLGKAKTFINQANKFLGDKYTVTERPFKSNTIIEILDIENSAYYYLTIIQNKLIFSLSHVLLEKVINEQHDLSIGRDLDFIEVSKYINNKGHLDVYVPISNFNVYLQKTLTGESPIEEIAKQLHYLGLYFDINEKNQVNLYAKASVNDTVPSIYSAIIKSGEGKSESAEIAPNRSATFLSLTFNSFDEFYQNLRGTLSDEELKKFDKDVKRFENLIDIDFQENFIDWIDDELAFVQTQPSNLGKHNEFAFILKGKNVKIVQKNFEFINKQIDKNMPVKFSSVNYKDYKIEYMAMSGLIKVLFGRMLDKMEKPYYTIIDRYVVFSNHPQTLKNIIDDYLENKTLTYDASYYNFKKGFSSQSTVFTYIQTPIAYNNLAGIVDSKTYASISKNKEYFLCFPQIGIELNTKDKVLSIDLKADFKQSVEEVEPLEVYEMTTIPSVPKLVEEEVKPEIQEMNVIINDLDANNQKDYFENGNLKYTLDLKHGLKHGTYKEYYENGELKVKGKYKEDKKTGSWEYYNQDGEELRTEDF